MKNITRKSFIGMGAGALALGAFASPLQAFAVTSAEKQAEADAVAVQLADFNNQLNQASEDYYAAIDAHDAAIAAMDEAQGRIDAANATISELQGHLGTRANRMYKQGNSSFFEVLLGATSFDQFVSTFDTLNTLNQQDADWVSQTKAARQEAQDAHDEYTRQEQIAAEELAKAEEVKANAESLVDQYQATYDSLEAEVAELAAQEAAELAAREAAAAAAAAAAASSDDGGGGGGAYVGYNANTGNAIVDAAYSQLGVPYVWGGTSPGVGLDCSGLTQYCYRCAGISIPRTSHSQYAAGAHISASEAQAGDIIYWTHGHVAIYLGGSQMIEAQQTGVPVKVSNLRGNYAFCRF